MTIANKTQLENSRRRSMKTSAGHRWMGLSAFAIAVFLVREAVTKLTMGRRPELDDSMALVEYIGARTTQTFIVILADTFLMAFLIVFLACFQHLVTASRPTWRGSLRSHSVLGSSSSL